MSAHECALKAYCFMLFSGSVVMHVPMIGKHPLDLFRLYHIVKERGGLQEVG